MPFQITVTYLPGTTQLTFAYPNGQRKPHTRKAKGGVTYMQVLAWCAKNGTAVDYGANWQRWSFNSSHMGDACK